MGRSKEEKARSHRRIVEVAAAKFREGGIEGIGIADLMAASDLSHGGFYRHFESRDELVAEAMELAIEHNAKRTEAVCAEGAAPFDAFVDAYLSPEHRDNRGESCAVSALANDVARSDTRTRAAYTRRVRDYLAMFSEQLGGNDKESRRFSITSLSALVGAVIMARAVDDEALSIELLRDTAAALKSAADIRSKGAGARKIKRRRAVKR